MLVAAALSAGTAASCNHDVFFGGLPLAIIDADMNPPLGSRVQLSASRSSGFYQTQLSYAWTFVSVPGGSSLDNSAITGAKTAEASFMPDILGSYTVRLWASDGYDSSSADAVIVVREACIWLLTDAPADSRLGETVFLSAAKSVNEVKGQLVFAWSFESVPGSSALHSTDLSGSRTADASFTPDVAGVYVVRVVAASTSSTASKTISIDVSAP